MWRRPADVRHVVHAVVPQQDVDAPIERAPERRGELRLRLESEHRVAHALPKLCAGLEHYDAAVRAAMAGVLVAGANVSRRACVLERAHRQEAVDGVQLCCLLAGALQAGESAGILVLSGILVRAT